MRIFSERRQYSLENDSYKKMLSNGKTGKYNIRMTRKQASMMDSRRFSLDLTGVVNWVEDGFHVVMGQMMISNDSLLPYLGIAYPSSDLMAANERHTGNKDERRTLLFRLRHMLRSLKIVKDKFELFEQWRFSGLEFAMQSFDDMIKQAFDPSAHNDFNRFYLRLCRIWKVVAPELDSPEDVGRELDSLIDEAEAVFATLRRCCELKETEIAQAQKDVTLLHVAQKVENAADKVEVAADKVEVAVKDVTAASSDIRETNRLSRKAVKVVESVVGIDKPRINAEEDKTSREAAVRRLNPSRKRQVFAASDISLKGFAVTKKPGKGENSLLKLAKKTWARHREEFEQLAKLETAPGYASAEALAAALYRIAENFPESAIFQWLPSTSQSSGSPLRPRSSKPAIHKPQTPNSPHHSQPSQPSQPPQPSQPSQPQNMV